MAMPFVYSILACGAGFFIIAATTVTFSEEKTTEWLVSVIFSLVRHCMRHGLPSCFFH
eukprot:SAG22_NODE_244_length_14023_cov_45.200661_5_plen_58_part_00